MSLVIFFSLLSIINGCDSQEINLTYIFDESDDLACSSLLASDHSGLIKQSKNLALPQTDRIRYQRFRLKPKQTLTNLLSPFGLRENEVYLISQAMDPYIKANKLHAGQNINLKFKGDHISVISFVFEFNNMLTLTRGDNSWQASTEKLATNTSQSTSQGNIQRSLYQSLIQTETNHNKMPLAIYHQYVSLMSYFVDLQRDLRAGDQFYLTYTTRALQDNPKIIQAGVIEYAELKMKNETIRLYRYKINNEENYYDKSGNLVGSFLIKTPVKGGVLSSHYGQRKHPVLGYTRVHKGLDFSAPTGTPIIAAGRGKVIRAGWSNSFGNFVKIEHAYGYHTLYAHLKKISQKIKKGKRLRQGEVIGFLGSTGLTAGRHLHYEIHKNGKAINPASIKQKHPIALDKHQLHDFKKHIENYNAG